jgi:hypothetical protein
MIFSFGPGVYFLYAERWKNSRIKQGSSNNKGLNRLVTACLIIMVIAGGVVLANLHVSKKRPPDEFTLTKDTNLQGVIFPSGSHISFSNGRIDLVTLSEPLAIQDIKCQKLARVGFYPSGKIKYVVGLSESQEMQGWLCAKDIEVSFYESGKINTAGLESGATIQGMYFPARTEIFLYESGRLEGARMSRVGGSFEINGISCDTGCEFYFHESGALMQAALARDQEVSGVFCKKGAHISFDKNGKAIFKE